MCQLLGMNCNVPTDICFSFTGFQARGGVTDVHTDGWGIAFFEGKGVRQFLDPVPSARSPIADLVRGYPIRSKNVIAHIRKATQGVISLENTHPFLRALWGTNWVFAHNGNIPNYFPRIEKPLAPVGDTDSERVFCSLLQALLKRFPEGPASDREVFNHLHELIVPIAALGEFNFLLSNGEFLIAHASTKLSYIVRQAPFAEARLKDQDVCVDFSQLTTANDRVAVIATEPLTLNETWTTIAPGTLVIFKEGQVVETRPTVPGPPKS